ncbi:crossover junction endonuclease MUS81 [Anolis carolinensis]|uniref:crossover junction endonuclease MUS81 n=1 Tax=Anolis carolinensis TaxID=28377 RepID=UPI002F2B3624
MPKPHPVCPNPLFMRWLQEWRDEAAERGRARSQRAYERALSSLRKYPLPLHSGREARILQYFGEQICRQLEERLERHREDTATTDLPPQASTLKTPNDAEPSSYGATSTDRIPGPQSDLAQCPESHIKVSVPFGVWSPYLSMGDKLDLSPWLRSDLGTLMLKAGKKQLVSRRRRARIPTQRSAAYAVLVALYRDTRNPESRGYLTKPELQRAAQPLCDKSFCLADPGDKKTAWSAVCNLIRKELVLKTSIPARYSLTESGLSLARELAALEDPKDDARKTSPTTSTRSRELCALSEGEGEDRMEKEDFPRSIDKEPERELLKPQFTLQPGQFDVVLCVDVIETTGGPASRKQELVEELRRHHVPFSVRKLHVGDFLWVARERVSPATAQELVLDYVVERKKMPDLCSSIIDGRYREQKFRLRQCGLSHPIYLMEDAGSVGHLSLPEKTLQQAVVNTQVVDGFFVKRTRDIRESAAYLTVMTRHLARLYGDRTLVSCTREELQPERPPQTDSRSSRLLTFAEFNESAVKNKAQTVREVFARQLLQLSGISGDKATALLDRFPTPASLRDAFAACPSSQAQEQMLSGTKCGKLQRNLGPVLSKSLAQLYCTPGPLP